MYRLNWITFTLCLLFSTLLLALRCGHSLVQSGDRKSYANINQNNFGQNRRFPNNSFNYGQSHHREIEVLIEEWTYDFGSARLRKLLRFENGKLIDVENLGRRRHR